MHRGWIFLKERFPSTRIYSRTVSPGTVLAMSRQLDRVTNSGRRTRRVGCRVKQAAEARLVTARHPRRYLHAQSKSRTENAIVREFSEGRSPRVPDSTAKLREETRALCNSALRTMMFRTRSKAFRNGAKFLLRPQPGPGMQKCRWLGPMALSGLEGSYGTAAVLGRKEKAIAPRLSLLRRSKRTR
jgi:hypothetical protein